jgi:hypothetical protein
MFTEQILQILYWMNEIAIHSRVFILDLPWSIDLWNLQYTVQKEEPVRLILLMQRENILYMTYTTDVASFLADF